MHFPDMGTTSLMLDAPHVRAVGWLDAPPSFSAGRGEPAVLDRICAFAKAWPSSVEALGWPCAARRAHL